MEIIPLNKSHHQEFLKLNEIVMQTLPSPIWFIPFSEQTLARAFDEDSPLNICGAIHEGRLVGFSLYDTDEGEWGELADALGRKEGKRYAEIGGSMVQASFRGNNLMYEINKKVVALAKENGIDILVATAHPDNIASNRSLLKLGMKKSATIMRGGKYLRNVYVLNL